MTHLAKTIRILTIPPVLAFAMTTTLFLCDAALLGSFLQYCAMIIFLSVLPILAYPLQPFLPAFKHKGREGQRSLAFIASVIGYLGGIIFAFLTSATQIVHVIYWTYLVSVAVLVIFNKITPWRASGHACGVAGPLCTFVYFIGPQTLPLVLIFALMVWASLKIKRHTPVELILGGADSVLAFFLVLTIARIIS